MSNEKQPINFESQVEAAAKAEGVKLEEIKVGESYKIATKNTEYVLEHREDGFYISGNSEYCPNPRKVLVRGSTWGGSSIIGGFVGIGMYLEADLIEGKGIRTSKIEGIEKLE